LQFVVIDQDADVFDGQLAEACWRGHEGQAPQACILGQGHPFVVDPLLVLVDDHLYLSGVADISSRLVVADGLDAFEQGRSQFDAIGEGAPFRQDVAVDSVPADREVWFVDVDVIGRFDE
jgi:hypothetical protein